MPVIPAGTTLAEMMSMWNSNTITSDTLRYWLNAAGFDGDSLMMDMPQLQSLVDANPNASTEDDFTPPAPPGADDSIATNTGGQTGTGGTGATTVEDTEFFKALSEGVGAWDPSTRYRDYMREQWQMKNRPMGERIRGERRLGQGYQPALGGYLATESMNPRAVDYGDATPGDVFSAYLRQDQQPTLDQIRASYGQLASALSQGTAGTGAYDAYQASLYGFGDEQRAKETRSNMLASALSALGGNPFAVRGSETLGQVYDAMMGGDKYGGYGDFSKWISSAYTQPSA